MAAIQAPGPARADVNGYAVGRFDPSERGSTWFANESLDFRGHLRPAAGLVTDFATQPLVLTGDGGSHQALVTDQLFVHLGGAFTLGDRARVGISLPVAGHESGHTVLFGGRDLHAPPRSDIGDVRLGTDLRLVGAFGAPFTLALGAQIYLPSGRRDSFTGDETLRTQTRALVAGEIGALVYAARAGLMFRPLAAHFAGAELGSELTFGGAVGTKLAGGRVVLGPELFGSAVVTGADAWRARKTPLELLLGIHGDLVADWRAGVGIGGHLTDGEGAPTIRVVASVEWAPGPSASASTSVP